MIAGSDIAVRRPWYQIHLSTVIVLLVTAGVLIYANLYTRRTYENLGWPFPAIILGNAGLTSIRISNSKNFLKNLAACLTVLAMVGGICETALRQRREWFQVHLSTVFISTLVAGLFIALNTLPRLWHDGYAYTGQDIVIEAHGWPSVYAHRELTQIDVRPLVEDICVAIFGIGLCACCCEYFIRRREARKPEMISQPRH